MQTSTQLAGTLAQHLNTLQVFVLGNTFLIAAAILTLTFLSGAIVRVVPARDKRTGFLAKFLGMEEDNIIPLPPATALWRDFSRLNREANPAAHIPPGAPTLQGSYLVHSHGGFALVAVHNFDSEAIYRDPNDPGLVDFVTASLTPSGRMMPQRIGFEIEQDATRRANMVEFLLKVGFGYPGIVRPITLLRDRKGQAPEPECETTESGAFCERFTFDEKDRLLSHLAQVEDEYHARDIIRISSWFRRWPGRQTSLPRRMWRAGLLVLCAAMILASGETTIVPDILAALRP